MKKLNVMKKSTKIAIISVVASLLSVLLVLSGIGIYFAFKKDKQNPAPEVIVNPIAFSVDKWDGKSVSSAQFVSSYAGRSENSVTIDSAQSFIYFIEQVNSGETYETVYLNCSVDMSGYTIPSITNFKGTFDGGFYNILNANIQGNALFEQTENATIKNLGLYNCTINGNETSAGLIKTAVDTDIENVFVRLGEIKGTTTSGLVNEFISNNNTIVNSFVDANNLTYGLVGSVGGDLTIDTCYYTNSTQAAPEGVTLTNVIHNPTSLTDFSVWQNYRVEFSPLVTWCDYDYIENSTKLNFNYPVQANFVKVYTTGSFYESVVTIDGNFVDNTTSLSSAFNAVGANNNAEIKLIVEQVVANEAMNVGENSEINLSSVTDSTTIVRGDNNTSSLINATSANSKLTLGNNITLDGNKAHTDANNAQSGALITSLNNNVVFGENITLKNNTNNTSAGGAVLIVCDTPQNLELSINVENCSSTLTGGAICVVGSGVTLKNGKISNCSSTAENGAAVVIMGMPEEEEEIESIKAIYGNNIVKKLSTTINGGNQTTLEDGTTLENYIFSNCKSGAIKATGSLTIKNSTFTGNSISSSNNAYGGAVNASGSLTIENSTFTENSVSASDYAYASGGAVYGASEVTITDSTFKRNSARWDKEIDYYDSGLGRASGGAVYSVGKCIIQNSTFEENYAYAYGQDRCSASAIYACNSGGLTIQNSSFISNSPNPAYYDEFYDENSDYYDNDYFNSDYSTNCVISCIYEIKISNSIFDSNGYAAFSGYMLYSSQRGISIINSTFNQNDAPTLINLNNNSSSVTIRNSTFTQNMKTVTEYIYGAIILNSTFEGNNYAGTYYTIQVGDGGALIDADADNDGIADSQDSEITTTNYTGQVGCVFSNNGSNKSIREGGAIYVKGDATISCSTFNNNTSSKNGGAVYTLGSLTIKNSTFNGNNSGDNSGGAVYAIDSVTVTNSTLNNNTAGTYGGAVYAGGAITISDSTLNNNTASSEGGAVYATDAATVTNSTFTNNTATGVFSNGGAVRSYGALTITNSTFTNNTSTMSGGAVYVSGSVIIENSTFTENSGLGDGYSSDRCGGAVCTNEDATILNSTFKGNTSSRGGAIYTNKDATILNSNFNGNTSSYGGAVYTYKDATILNSTFNGNTSSSGGAVYVSDAVSLIVDADADNDGIADSQDSEIGTTDYTGQVGCVFSNNVCGVDGSVIYFYNYSVDESYSNIANSSFINNVGDDSGATYACNGVIYAPNMDNLTVRNCTFTGNTATRGPGIIYSLKGLLTILNSTFIDNVGEEAAIHGRNMIIDADADNDGIADSQDSIIGTTDYTGQIGCVFNNNRSNDRGGSIFALPGTVVVNNSIFTGNSCAGLSGGAIYANSSSVSSLSVNNCTFTGNSSAGSCGAICAEGAITIANSTFTNNSSVSSGGAICYGEDSTIDNCTFTGNTARLGGGIYSVGTLTANNCTFTGNTSTHGGGAVYAHGNGSSVIITDSTFINNISTSNGGAIYSDSDVDLTKINFEGNQAKRGGAVYSDGWVKSKSSTFISNTAKSASGGAIYCKDITIEDCDMLENSANTYGGAIHVYDQSSIGIPILNSNLSNNETSRYAGGAVYFNSPNLHRALLITNSILNNNTAATNGGAVWSDLDVRITNSTLNNNYAYDLGGAVWSDVAARITNSTLNNNGGRDGGGAVYAGASVTITDSILNNNSTDSDHGGAVYVCQIDAGIKQGSLIVTGSTLQGNTCNIDSGTRGGALYAYTAEVVECILTENSAWFGGAIYSEDEITVQNCEILHNNANNSGAIHSLGDLTITDSNISYNNATGSSAGGIHANSINASNINFNNNTSSAVGGAIYLIDSTTSSTFNNCYFTENSSKRGGAIFANNIPLLTIKDSYILSNTAENNGGAIWSSAELEFENCNFLNNTSTTEHGGAVWCSNASTFTNVVFTENEAVRGGAIYSEYTSEMQLYNISFIDNVSDYFGGAIYSKGNISVVSTDGSQFYNTFTQNVSQEGGAVYTSGHFSAECCMFNGNEAGSGGAVYANSISVDDIIAFENKSNYIGGVFYSITDVYVSCSTFDSNTAHNGAVSYSEKTTTFEQVAAANNIATKEGGVAYSTGEVNIIDSILMYNKGKRGGAIYCGSDIDFTNVTAVENSADQEGGVAYATGNLAFSDSQLLKNSAGNSGGAIYTNRTVTLTNVMASGNSAGTYGGAINCGALEVDMSVFTYNTSGAGGAIHFWSGGKITNSIFENNQALSVDAGHGGAIYTYGGELLVSECSFTNNSSTMSGGSIHCRSQLDLSDSTIAYSTSGLSGGAICAYDYINIENTDISHCSAGTRGGALYIGNATIANTNISNCSAGEYGGAISIYLNSSETVSITNTNIFKNTAPNYAAISVNSNTTIELIGCNIYENTNNASITSTSETDYLENAVVLLRYVEKIEDCYFFDNIAASSNSYCGSIVKIRYKGTNFNNVVITNNIGNGVYFTDISLYSTDPSGKCNSYFSDCNITNNTGSGIYYPYYEFDPPEYPIIRNDITIENSIISNNGGHGVFSIDGNIIVTNSNITDNGSDGVAAEDGDITITNSTISGNTGDGVYVVLGDATITNSEINSNMTGDGVAAYDGDITITYSTISNNSGNAVRAGGSATIRDSELIGNTTSIITGADCTITNSIIRFHSDGVSTTGMLTIINSVITDNDTYGIKVKDGGLAINMQYNSTTKKYEAIENTHTIISGNGFYGADSGEVYYGGVIYECDDVDCDFYIANADITNNTGYGIYAYNFNPITITNSTISGNTGDGVYSSDSVYINMQYNSETKNYEVIANTHTIISNNGRSGICAGLYSYVANATISGNTGDGIEGSYQQYIINSTISDNGGNGVVGVADLYINVLYNSETKNYEVIANTHTIISNNGGHGIYRNDITNIANTTISGNAGAGIDAGDSDYEIEITNSTISDNGSYGIFYVGWLYDDQLYGDNLSIVNSTISNNRDCAIVKCAGDLTVINSNITNNAGGIYLSGGYIYINAKEVDGEWVEVENTLTTISGNGDKHPEIKYYFEYEKPSAVYIDSGDTYIYNADITHNAGDGVDMLFGSATISGSTISNNTGNGVSADSDSKLINSTVSDNGENGVIIWTGGLTAINSVITNNTQHGVCSDNSLYINMQYNSETRKWEAIENTHTVVSGNGSCGLHSDTFPDFHIVNADIFNNGDYGLYCGSADVVNCNIIGNGNTGVYARDGHIIVEDSTISKNKGYGVYGLITYSDNTITNSIITENTNTGVVFAHSEYEEDIGSETPCTITGSEISNNGGDGVSYNQSNYGNSKLLTISDCEIFKNTGRGVYTSGAVTITNSKIYDHTTTTTSGAGVYANGNVIVTDSHIYNNHALRTDITDVNSSENTWGGAIYTSSSEVNITNSFIYNNSANKAGGISAGKVTIKGSTFNSNTSTVGDGGAILSGPSGITIEDSFITYNNANTSGGGVVSQGTAVIKNTTISNNTATQASAIIAWLGIELENCTISNNITARTTSGGVGVIMNGYSGYPINLTNCVVSNNKAEGGVVYINGTSTITNSTFTGNNSTVAYGATIWNAGAELTITGSTFAGNTANTHGGVIYSVSTDTSTAVLNIGEGNKFYGNVAKSGNGGAIHSLGTLNIADVGMIYGNYASAGYGNDIYCEGTINFTGDAISSINRGYETSVYYGNDFATVGNIAAITTSGDNAAKVLSALYVENGTQLVVDTNNVIFRESGYTATINPNGGTISYTTGTGENAITSEVSSNPITFYLSAGSKKLYTTSSLTTEVTAINLHRDGYTSIGIYTSDDGGAQVIAGGASEFNFAWNDPSMVSFYAQWQTVVYSISYNVGDGKLAINNPSTYTIESEDITINNPTKPGYTFVGWNDGTTTLQTVTIPTGSFGDKTYTAVYAINKYTVKWEVNGAIVETDENVEYLTKPEYNGATPTREGCSFIGWSVDGGKSILASLESIVIVENLTFKAMFHTITITVNNVDYGTVSSSNVTADLSGGYDITSIGNVITIIGVSGSESVTATNKTGYIFDKWVVSPDYEKQETKITAIFSEAITVTVNVTGAITDNAYGIIVYKDGAEVGRYNAKQTNSIQLVKNGNYRIDVYCNLISNVASNEYQILKIKVNGDEVVYDSGKTSVKTETVFVTTEEDKLDGNLEIDLEYISAYLMQVEYTTNNIITGVTNVRSTDGVVVNRVTELGGYIISKGSTISFEVDSTIKTGVTLTQDYYYAKLTYLTTAGTKVTQGYAEIGKAINFEKVENSVYYYTTNLEIAKLTVGVLVQVVEFNSATLDWSKVSFTSLNLTSQEGHFKQVSQATGVLTLYASSWKIDLPSGTTSSVSELQAMFGSLGTVINEGGSFYLMVSGN